MRLTTATSIEKKTHLIGDAVDAVAVALVADDSNARVDRVIVVAVGFGCADAVARATGVKRGSKQVSTPASSVIGTAIEGQAVVAAADVAVAVEVEAARAVAAVVVAMIVVVPQFSLAQ